MQTSEREIGSILSLYQALMEEIKVRIDALLSVGRLGVHRRIAFEFGQLLVRLICEDIALACLVAHGEIAATTSKRLRKAWQPVEIMRKLEEAHPNFYPHPASQDLNDRGYITGFLPFDGSYLTKEKLRDYWSRAGNDLHRGNVDSLIDLPEPDFALLNKFAAEVRDFLNQHHIALFDGQREIWVLMQERTTGRVNVRLMQRTSASQP